MALFSIGVYRRDTVVIGHILGMFLFVQLLFIYTVKSMEHDYLHGSYT